MDVRHLVVHSLTLSRAEAAIAELAAEMHGQRLTPVQRVRVAELGAILKAIDGGG